MTHEERLAELEKHLGGLDVQSWAATRPFILQALRTVDLEALERAAKVADELIVGNEPGPLHSHVAQQIRSLKEQAKEEDSEGVR